MKHPKSESQDVEPRAPDGDTPDRAIEPDVNLSGEATGGTLTPESMHWREYDAAAEWCARHGIAGNIGDPLPDLITPSVHDEINADPEAFQAWVRETAYMLARGEE